MPNATPKTQNPSYEAEEGYIEMFPNYVGQADAYAAGDFEIEMPPDPLNAAAAARVAADAAHDQSATMHNIADDLQDAYWNAVRAGWAAHDAKADADNAADTFRLASATTDALDVTWDASKAVADDAADAATLADAAAEAASAIEDAYGEAIAIEAEDWF